MNDLISRQAVIDLFPNDALEWDTYWGYIAPHFARRMIEELPSAQPEIIRCKECKWHWRVTEFRASGYCENDKCFDGFHFETDNDFYCGYAEREEE